MIHLWIYLIGVVVVTLITWLIATFEKALLNKTGKGIGWFYEEDRTGKMSFDDSTITPIFLFIFLWFIVIPLWIIGLILYLIGTYATKGLIKVFEYVIEIYGRDNKKSN